MKKRSERGIGQQRTFGGMIVDIDVNRSCEGGMEGVEQRSSFFFLLSSFFSSFFFLSLPMSDMISSVEL